MKKIICLLFLGLLLYGEEGNTTLQHHEISPIFLKEPAVELSTLPSLKTEKLIDIAFDLQGIKYRFGAKGMTGTDCSGYTQRVFSLLGVELPRSASEQANVGKYVKVDNIQRGDLLFFRTYKKGPSHVGIYLGDGKMIHASTRGRKVMVDDISKGYYSKRYLFAKRVNLL